MPAYATLEDFARLCPGVDLPGQEELNLASDEVDALCFGRIRRAGFQRLTLFQQERVTKAVCLHAAFLTTYGDELQSPLASYGINGVSMAFDGTRMASQGGVTTSKQVYSQLQQSGLAHRGVW